MSSLLEVSIFFLSIVELESFIGKCALEQKFILDICRNVTGTRSEIYIKIIHDDVESIITFQVKNELTFNLTESLIYLNPTRRSGYDLLRYSISSY